MKHKKITLMVTAMSIALSLSACGSVAQTGSVESSKIAVESVAETEVAETEVENTEKTVTENTEEIVPEETESVAETVTEVPERVADEAVINVKTLSTDTTASARYTYSEVSKTMYAKSTVNVRSLPSTNGDKLGSFSKNQEVTVTGQCNETGWYRIKLNDSDAYVSNKYLSDEPATTAASTSQANKTASKSSTQSTGDPIADAAIAKFGPNAVVFADGTIFDATTWQQVGTVNDLDGVDLSNSNISVPNNGSTTTVADGYNRAAAEQIWSLMNAERTAAGLNALTWDEDIYNFACQRAQAIVTDYSHSGCGNYGENIYSPGLYLDANSIHQGWHDSPGHYANYMNADYKNGACAVYTYNGVTYAVENFTQTNAHDAYYGTSQTRESNGETLDLTGPQAEAFDNGNTWTASNGVVVYIQSDGGLSTSGADMDSAMAAFNEYDATH